jgi:glycosyltransferase involved in cell wall biosynthesis
MLCWCYRIKIVHGHGFGPALFALIAKKVKGSIKVVADLHGLSVEEYMYSLKGSHRDKLAELLQEREILVLHRADWIIFVSQAMRKYFEEKHRSYFKNFSVIPCATESTFEIDHGRREVLRREYGLSGKRVFCYVGSAAPYQRVERMCHLFGEILRLFPDSFFLAFSHHRDVFLSYLKDLEINPSNYKLASVDHDKILDLLQIGDIGLLLRDDSIVNRVASPTKFAEYCLSGLPIITTAFVGDFSELVKQYRLGWIIDLANLNADSSLTAFINEVQENRLEYAKRCSSFAKEHISWEVYGKALASVYTNFIGGARIEAPLTSD